MPGTALVIRKQACVRAPKSPFRPTEPLSSACVSKPRFRMRPG